MTSLFFSRPTLQLWPGVGVVDRYILVIFIGSFFHIDSWRQVRVMVDRFLAVDCAEESASCKARHQTLVDQVQQERAREGDRGGQQQELSFLPFQPLATSAAAAAAAAPSRVAHR